MTDTLFPNNHNGVRIEKEASGVKTEYFLDESKIIAEVTDNKYTYCHYDTNDQL